MSDKSNVHVFGHNPKGLNIKVNLLDAVQVPQKEETEGFVWVKIPAEVGKWTVEIK